MIKTLLTIALLVATVGYPFAVYVGLTYFTPAQLALGLLALAVARLGMAGTGQAATSPTRLPALVVLGLVAAYAAYSASSNSEQTLRHYPVFVNIIMLTLFIYTLLRPPSMIEQLARLREPNLDSHGVRYTYKVTITWCLFFLVNGAVAYWTARYGSWQQWSLYNGLISYLLMGTLFTAEWLLRQRVRNRDARGSQ